MSSAVPHPVEEQTSESEVIGRLSQFVQIRAGGWLGCILRQALMRRFPSRIQKLAKVANSKTLIGDAATGKVEDYRSFHRSEKSVARVGGCIIEEIILANATVFTFSGSLSNDSVKG